LTHGTCARECLGIAEPAATFVDPPAPPDLVAHYVDLHVHTAPDVYGRALDDDEAAAAALRAHGRPSRHMDRRGFSYRAIWAKAEIPSRPTASAASSSSWNAEASPAPIFKRWAAPYPAA
jgi:hypothetical protein